MGFSGLVWVFADVILLTAKDKPMKNIVFKKNIDAEDKTKSLSIIQQFEDKECKTEIQKSFRYAVSSAELNAPQVCEPQIYITKSIDTKKKVEMFNFQVKGSFYITHIRLLWKVEFHHTLDIKINWKEKIFSPKKSEVLTK